MNQSKINAGGINQQPMDAVSAAIANSININVQSIFKQYTKRQNPMNAKLTSMHSASNQCGEYQQPVYRTSNQCNALSTTNEHNINPQSVNSQCGYHQTPYARFLQNEDFHSLQYASHPVILRGAKGEVAESILPESTLSQGVWRDRPQRPITLYQSSNSSLQRALSNGTGENACGGLW